MAEIILENDAMRVGVLPQYGARVVSLIDKRSDRNWVFPGGDSGSTGEDAVYSEDEAIGWDECFPTVSAFEAQHTPWRRRLRDHGDLWGRPWQVGTQSTSTLATTYIDPQFDFTRTLRLDGVTLTADYCVENKTAEALPYLWAQHNLMTVSPADRIEFTDAAQVTATFLSLDGKSLPKPNEFAWPGPDAGLPFPLDAVQPASAHLAAKLLVHGIPSRSVALGHDSQWLTIAWDGIDDLGIWLTYGGWPSVGGVYHLALEPQTFFADDLGQAIERGAPPVRPHGSVSWRTTMTVSAAR